MFAIFKSHLLFLLIVDLALVLFVGKVLGTFSFGLLVKQYFGGYLFVLGVALVLFLWLFLSRYFFKNKKMAHIALFQILFISVLLFVTGWDM
jgi:hypothetical protein